jgi:hypothetical protein
LKGTFNGWFDLKTGEINIHVCYSRNKESLKLIQEMKKDFRKWWKKFAKKNPVENTQEKNCSFKDCEIYIKKRKKSINNKGYNE